MVGPGGDMWFTASDAVCRMTRAGVVSRVVAASAALDLCTGPDGNVWYTRATGDVAVSGVVRVLETAEATPWVANVAPTFQAGTRPCCASGAGGFWTLANCVGTQAVKVEP
jgi:streptogramin lyase